MDETMHGRVTKPIVWALVLVGWVFTKIGLLCAEAALRIANKDIQS